MFHQLLLGLFKLLQLCDRYGLVLVLSWQLLSAAERFVCFFFIFFAFSLCPPPKWDFDWTGLKKIQWSHAYIHGLMKLWLCILDDYNHNFLLETSVLWQSWLLLCLHCQIWTIYGIIRQYLPCNHWYVFLGFVLGFFGLVGFLFQELYVCWFFSAPKLWTFFASVWFPKILSLWLLTKSHLGTLFNCSHLCFHFAFASWHALHLCSACYSHLLDHPSYSASQW